MSRSKVFTLLFALSLTLTPVFADDVNDMFYPADNMQFYVDEEVQRPVLKAFTPLSIEPGDVIFKQITRKVDLIDPAATTSYYPGGRGPNKLVIYTADYGEHTGTNEFGTEAIVTGNIVTSLSGADSVIPKDGIVISGHGAAKTWISQNISVGSKVYIDPVGRTITVYTTSDSYTYDAQTKIDEALSIINYYKQNNSNYNSVLSQEHIQKAQRILAIGEEFQE